MSIATNRLSLFDTIRYFLKYNKKRIFLIIGILLGSGILSYLLFTYCIWYQSAMKHVSSMIKTITDVGNADKIKSYMETNLLEENVGGLDAIHQILKSAAVGLAVILWAPTILHQAINNQAYEEIVIKRFIYLGACLALIVNSNAICSGIKDIGSTLVHEIGEKVTTNETSTDSVSTADLISYIGTNAEAIYNGSDPTEIFEEVDDENKPSEDSSKKHWFNFNVYDNITKGFSGIGDRIKAWWFVITVQLHLIIPWAVSFICQVIIIVCCYMRAIEMSILIMISPIPFALLGNDPFGSGAGSRFIKNFAALSIQGGIMMIIARVCSSLIIVKLGDMVSLLASGTELGMAGLELSAIMVCEAALLKRSLTFSQKALGLQ